MFVWSKEIYTATIIHQYNTIHICSHIGTSRLFTEESDLVMGWHVNELTGRLELRLSSYISCCGGHTRLVQITRFLFGTGSLTDLAYLLIREGELPSSGSCLVAVKGLWAALWELNADDCCWESFSEELSDSRYFCPEHLFSNQLLRFICTWRSWSYYKRFKQVALVITYICSRQQ